MNLQTHAQTVRTLAAAIVLLAAAAGCGENERLIGSGGALTTTPCDQCLPSTRPPCAGGEVAACFKRESGTCDWAPLCVAPPAADAGVPAPGPVPGPAPGPVPGPGPVAPDAGPTCPARVCTAIACAHGYKKDSAGCPTCECNPPPACDAKVCPAIACEHGNKKDGNGCPTCECNPPPMCAPQLCPAIVCEYGYKKDAAGCPSCHCNPPPDVCATVLCPPNSRCEAQPVMCVAPPCKPVPVCVPIKPDPTPSNPCAVILCPVNTVCVAKPVTCVRAPCPPVAECVPRVPCGGIAGLECPGSGSCQDDPGDSCDPARGGRDCGGLCICKQPAECPPDRVWNDSPAVCACVPVGSGGACGKNTCAADQYCCNASCGTCTPHGGACDARACGP